jgi:hypothetical protein
LFSYTQEVANLLNDLRSSANNKMAALAALLGDKALPGYLTKYILQTTSGNDNLVFVHPAINISGYNDTDTDKKKIIRRRGFIGQSQLAKAPPSTVHHLFTLHNSEGMARVVYKFMGSIQFSKNTSNDP